MVSFSTPTPLPLGLDGTPRVRLTAETLGAVLTITVATERPRNGWLTARLETDTLTPATEALMRALGTERPARVVDVPARNYGEFTGRLTALGAAL